MVREHFYFFFYIDKYMFLKNQNCSRKKNRIQPKMETGNWKRQFERHHKNMAIEWITLLFFISIRPVSYMFLSGRGSECNIFSNSFTIAIKLVVTSNKRNNVSMVLIIIFVIYIKYLIVVKLRNFKRL